VYTFTLVPSETFAVTKKVVLTAAVFDAVCDPCGVLLPSILSVTLPTAAVTAETPPLVFGVVPPSAGLLI
jgi:hypothetical protein